MGFKLSSVSREQANTKSGGGGGYLNPSKIPDGGSVKFHITSSEDLGFWEVWGTDDEGNNKPFRFVADPSPEDMQAELGENYTRREKRDGTGLEPPKFCQAFAVYDFDSESIKVCTFSQQSLRKELDSIAQDEDFSDFDEVNFKLSREGKMIDTRYTLRPVAAKAGDRKKAMAAMAAAEADGFDIKRLLTGGNPFSPE